MAKMFRLRYDNRLIEDTIQSPPDKSADEIPSRELLTTLVKDYLVDCLKDNTLRIFRSVTRLPLTLLTTDDGILYQHPGGIFDHEPESEFYVLKADSANETKERQVCSLADAAADYVSKRKPLLSLRDEANRVAIQLDAGISANCAAFRASDPLRNQRT